MSEAIKKLQEDGVAMMTYNTTLRHHVEETAALWQEFCALPQAEKDLFKTSDTSAGNGYEFKDGIGDHADRKENFDILLTGNNQLARKDTSPVGVAFVRHALQLTRNILPLVTSFGEQVEATYDIEGFAETVKRSSSSIFVRYLHYFGNRNEGELIAEPHTDQSGFTFHLFETDHGCERLDYATRQWQDMPVEAGKAAVFPAMQLQLAAHGELRALPHRVIATDSTKDIGRYAVVCFVRLVDTPVYDKERHGRLQEKTPGFNYDMTPDDFAELFKNGVAS